MSKKYENISIPKRENYQVEELSEDENDKFNELWDSFRDTKKILH